MEYAKVKDLPAFVREFLIYFCKDKVGVKNV